MLDSTTPLESIPASRKATRICVYHNGRFAASNETIAALQHKFPGVRIYKIDVLGDSWDACSIPDIETGDMTVADYVGWAEKRLHDQPNQLCRPYCNLSTWPALKDAVRAAPPLIRARTRYWIANPVFPAVAHIVPGSSATQYDWSQTYANVDISMVNEATWDDV